MDARSKDVVDIDELDCNRSPNASFAHVLDARLSRRRVLGGGVGMAGAAVLGSLGLGACAGSNHDREAPAGLSPSTLQRLSFDAVPKHTADVVSVPAGYTATVLYALGDPLDSSTPDYRNDGSDTGFATRAGDHHDGIEYFGLDANGQRDPQSATRGLLAMNHEALTDQFLHVDGATPGKRPISETDKEVDAHGVSIVEVTRAANGRFSTVRASSFNRRITPLTPVSLSGPVRGHALVRTRYSPQGTDARGTINNCGTGVTPWGTFLTGEENWAGYFTRGAGDDDARGGATARSVVSLKRYGRAAGAASRHRWETAGSDDKYQRWNISQTGASVDGSDDYRNELNTFGYIVEIDPYDRSAPIRKRTALGRFAHESASFATPVAGRPVVAYMGDDSQGEYIYKFVSAAPWVAADASAANRIATGDKYLDAGRLYVAKFADDGTGTWIELTITNPAIAAYANYAFADQADVLVNARLAADAVGATRMDRPEWCAVHPVTGEVYYTLTNNANRKVSPSGSQFGVDAANPRSYVDAKAGGSPGQPGNINGHIIRLREAAGNASASRFDWDVYLFGAEAGADPASINLSGLTQDQDFSSPDGIWFSRRTGLCFVQTDDGAYTDVSNCMMLAGVPGRVGDGSQQTIRYSRADGSTLAVDTHVGRRPSADALKRFLVGPKDCEITGVCETPDGRALFVNIQHPGETISRADVGDPRRYVSHWPGHVGYGAGGADARPRSATIVITKDDGGLIGT